MKLLFYLFPFLFLTVPSQSYAQSYFQQETDFIISSKLDEVNKTLESTCKLIYTNNSRSTLSEIYIHLYWNAFKSKTSAYADQLLSMREFDFHFSNNDQMGGYYDLSIFQNGHALSFESYTQDHKSFDDIVIVRLSEPCKAGETITITFDYKLKIPYSFSRAGYNSKLMQFTQWYPKPAVFDKNGWHPMPYLEYGEYYYDFGDYSISLDLPKTFKLANTGIITSEVESDDRKQYLLEANNVVDFAWFVSDAFRYENKTININGQIIQLKVFKIVK